MSDAERTYVTMAGKSIGRCSSGHWLPLRGDCDLCGAGPHEKCRYSDIATLSPALPQAEGKSP